LKKQEKSLHFRKFKFSKRFKQNFKKLRQSLQEKEIKLGSSKRLKQNSDSKNV
jgi:hypothetical protein